MRSSLSSFRLSSRSRGWLFGVLSIPLLCSLLMFGAWTGQGIGGNTPVSGRDAQVNRRRVAGSSKTGKKPKQSKRLQKTAVVALKSWKGRIRGMTVSCFGWGAAWATPLMRKAMVDLKALGSNWISYHPYAWIKSDGRLEFSRSLSQGTVLRPMKYGKELGMKILLKPHIGYWGTRFSWRGDIHFDTEAGWSRFFKSYTEWILVQAKMAETGKADLFSVGLEYVKTVHREADWRRVIAAVRRVYKGKITYSANWDTFEKVKFWDALDVIGVQAYFPITKAAPSAAALRKGWGPIVKNLRAFSKKHKKKIIFTELGYNRASHTAARPWDHKEGGPNAAQIKLRAMRVALEVLRKEAFLEGVFLWKWFPALWDISSNYTLQYPAMKKVLFNEWKNP